MFSNLRAKFASVMYVQIWEHRLKVTDTATRESFDDYPAIVIKSNDKGEKLISGVGKEASEKLQHNEIAINPFSHPRVLFSDFYVGEKLLQHTFKHLSNNKVLRPRPKVIIHPMEKTEGGLTMIEKRAFKELAIGAGAIAVKIHSGFELRLETMNFDELEDDDKVDFKIKAKQFVKIYGQMASIMPYEIVARACEEYPDRFYGLAGIDPFDGMDGVRAFEDAVQNMGFIGAHLYPHWYELAPDHAKYYPFYAKCCELDVPIQMQVGQSMVYSKEYRTRSVGQPITLDAVACDLPELKLIGIHVGIPWHDEMISMAWKHENIYIGCDAHRPKYWPKSFTHYVNSYGQDKVIFGTDFPVLDFKKTTDDINEIGFKPEVRKKLMRDNAIRIYGLDIE